MARGFPSRLQNFGFIIGAIFEIDIEILCNIIVSDCRVGSTIDAPDCSIVRQAENSLIVRQLAGRNRNIFPLLK